MPKPIPNIHDFLRTPRMTLDARFRGHDEGRSARDLGHDAGLPVRSLGLANRTRLRTSHSPSARTVQFLLILFSTSVLSVFSVVKQPFPVFLQRLLPFPEQRQIRR